MTFVLLFVVLVSIVIQKIDAFKPSGFLGTNFRSTTLSTNIQLAAKKKAWDREDLAERDIFEETDEIDIIQQTDNKSASKKAAKKPKFKLEPETTFFEGPPSATEIIFPALSIFTVIGIVPFISAVSRQFWVKYKFTSRRISIQSGFQGKELTEVIYPDIEEIRYVYRAFGSAGDMVLFLKDGAKVELRQVPKFGEIYDYVLSKVDENCREKSMKPTIKDQ